MSVLTWPATGESADAQLRGFHFMNWQNEAEREYALERTHELLNRLEGIHTDDELFHELFKDGARQIQEDVLALREAGAFKANIYHVPQPPKLMTSPRPDQPLPGRPNAFGIAAPPAVMMRR